MDKKFRTVGELRALLDAYPPETLVAVSGWRDRLYANIRLDLRAVPSVTENGGVWDYDLCEQMPGKPILALEADNPY